MAYQYVMPQGQNQQVNYGQGQQPQQSNQGMGMMQKALQGDRTGPLSNLFGGGDAYGFGGADPFSTSSYAGGEGAMAGGEAAGGGFGEMASSAGPWAALAAVIIGNEYNAQKGGYRSENTGDYAQDLIGGKVLEQDFSKRWLPSVFGEDLKNDQFGLGADTQAGADIMTLDFGNAWDNLKEGTAGKILGGIGDLFK